MKTTLGMFAGFLLAVGAFWYPAQAQQTPQGSYTSTCTDARMVGETLLAFCKKSDGTSQTAVLAESNRCTSDIRNNDGNLTCTMTSAVGSSTPPSTSPQPTGMAPTGTAPARQYPKAGGPSQPNYPPATGPGTAATPSGQPKGY